MPTRKRVLIISGYYNADVVAGFCRYAREARWMIHPFSILGGALPHAWHADGMLTTNVFRADQVRFVQQTAAKIPAVLHGCNDLGIEIANVECDEYAVGRQAAEHLLNQGHYQFAFLNTSRGLHAERRREGFHDRLRESGRTCIRLERISRDRGLSEPWLAARLRNLPRPLGLFAVDDILAAMAIDLARRCGWQIPQDMAVVGVGDIGIVAQYSQIPITSIPEQLEEEAYEAAAQLDKLMKRPRARRTTRVMPPKELILRASTDCLVARHPVVQRANDFMIKHLADPNLDSNAVANGVGVSQSTLYNACRANEGRTPVDQLTRLRMQRAKTLLMNSREKINSIYEQCGYASIRTFLRTFLRTEGLTPTNWRRKHAPDR